MKFFKTLMFFLRDRVTVLKDIRRGKKLDQYSIALLICTTLFLGIYGAVLGSFQGGLQLFSSALKLPALYLLTLFICLPSLFFFDVISGSRRIFPQYLTLLLGAMGGISVMLLGFAPITLFFRLSIDDYIFFTFLNIVILAISSIIGIQIFYRGMLFINEHQVMERKKRIKVLKLWLVLYGFVGSQLAWTLRPFLGMPGQPFQLFREIESNFYLQVVRIVLNLLGLNS